MDTLLNILGIVGGIVAFAGVVYLALNKAALENYKATVDSQEKRIAALIVENHELTCRVERLEGEKDGYALAARLFVEAVTTAGVCAVAWTCDDRVIPEPRKP